MIKAIDEVKKGTLSLRKASVKYDVPKSTLADRVKDDAPYAKKRPGKLKVFIKIIFLL